MRRHSLVLLVAVVLLAFLLPACTGGGGDGLVKSTPTPVPAQMTGMQGINAMEAEGQKPDCNKYPLWMGCSPAGQSVPVKELP